MVLFAYALWQDSGRSPDRSRRPLEAGIAVLIATIVIELLDPRRVSALPVDELGLLVFVVVVGLGLRRGRVSGIAPSSDEAAEVPIPAKSTSRPAPPAKG